MSDELIRRYDVLGKAQWIGATATWDDPWPEGKEAVTVEDIEAVPAVDAVEVCRCRDCKNWETDWEPNYFNPDNPSYYCGENDLFPTGNWFCADGQRREE